MLILQQYMMVLQPDTYLKKNDGFMQNSSLIKETKLFKPKQYLLRIGYTICVYRFLFEDEMF